MKIAEIIIRKNDSRFYARRTIKAIRRAEKTCRDVPDAPIFRNADDISFSEASSSNAPELRESDEKYTFPRVFSGVKRLFRAE